MSVHPDCETEYERRHNPIWPELAQALKEHGASNYSIFLDEKTNQLFAYVEIADESRWAALAQTEICHKWWSTMSDLMPSHEDKRPIARKVREVFHLD